VVVVGAGNAACVPHSPRRTPARGSWCSSAPRKPSAGQQCVHRRRDALRVQHLDEVREVLDLTEEEAANTDFGTYTEAEFLEDMGRCTQYRCDPDLTEIFVRQSRQTLAWMKSKGVRFEPMWARQSQKVDGR